MTIAAPFSSMIFCGMLLLQLLPSTNAQTGGLCRPSERLDPCPENGRWTKTVSQNIFSTTSGGAGTEPSNYNAMNDFCIAKGMRMCSYDELCPDGDVNATSTSWASSAPAWSGVIQRIFTQDLWIAYTTSSQFVSNDNTWVQLGNRMVTGGAGLEICARHEAIANGQKPPWGVDGAFFPFMDYTMCCDDDCVQSPIVS